MVKGISLMKFLLVLAGIVIVLTGLANHRVEINLLFLVASFSFLLSVIEGINLKRKNNLNATVDAFLGVLFLAAYLIVG